MLTLYFAAALLNSRIAGHRQAPIDTTYRWILLQANLSRGQDVDKAIATINAAAAAGYNGAIFEDRTLVAAPTVTPEYKAALDRLVAAAKQHKIELIPSMAPIGNPQALLDRDPSLVESMPYRRVRFVVTNGQLKPGEPPIPILNGGFEAFAGDLPTGFKGTHLADVMVAQDTAVHHGGASSLRVDGQPSSQSGKGGVTYTQPLVVNPWHQYRISVWTKATAATGADVSLTVLSSTGLPIGFLDWQITPDWVKNDMVFDSQAEGPITMSLTVQPVPGAKIWLDDLTLEDVGLLNVTRRPNCPLSIRGDDGVIYNEVTDVARVRDPFRPSGVGPGHFDISHVAPLPILTSNSRIHEGQSILLDYYAAAVVNGAYSICPNEPKTKAIMKSDFQKVVSLMHPRFVFLNISNVRALGWDPGCESMNMPAGDLIAKFIHDQANMVHTVDPSVQIATYSDMFDPFQNSVPQYFLMRGGTTGSIKGVPKDAIIVNWNCVHPAESLGFFAGQGLSQVLWGYQDNANHVLPIAQWEKMAGAVKGVKGFGYASWVDDYSHLADFEHAAMGGPN